MSWPRVVCGLWVVAAGYAPVLTATDPESQVLEAAKTVAEAACSATYADLVPGPGPWTTSCDPWIHHEMPPAMRDKIERAFEIAVGRVQELPQCAELFATLGADALEMLATTLYFPAGPRRQTTRCRHSLAVTSVGAPTTWVCRKVTAHTDERIAMALIHEALHHAGLDEYPRDRNGLDSGNINNLVMRSCDLE